MSKLNPQPESKAQVTCSEDVLAASDLLPKTRWASGQGGSMFWASHDVVDFLPPNLYRCHIDERLGPVLKSSDISTDELVLLPDETTTSVVAHITDFWAKKDEFTKRGFLHKRGILMYGDPGSGKTSAIQTIIQDIINRKGIALLPPINWPEAFLQCVQMIRGIDKTIPIVAILEDFDTMIEHEDHMHQWLSIQDGETQINNIVFLATTNYIEKIDKRFVDRPSRFDIIQPVPMPSALARAVYLYHKEPSLSFEEIKQWVGLTNNMSIAHLKETIISVKCFDNNLHETVDRLRKMHARNFKMKDVSGGENQEVGFGFNVPESEEEVDWEEYWRLIGVDVSPKAI